MKTTWKKMFLLVLNMFQLLLFFLSFSWCFVNVSVSSCCSFSWCFICFNWCLKKFETNWKKKTTWKKKWRLPERKWRLPEKKIKTNWNPSASNWSTSDSKWSRPTRILCRTRPTQYELLSKIKHAMNYNAPKCSYNAT